MTDVDETTHAEQVSDSRSLGESTTEPPADETLLDLSEELRSLRSKVDELAATLDQVVPHLVSTLKRNQAYETVLERLDDAEKRLAARRDAPIASVLLRTLNEINRMRHLDPKTRRTLVHGVSSSLLYSGYEIIAPERGGPFDAERHTITDGETSAGGHAVVVGVDSYGLACLGDLIVPAKVTVGPVQALEIPDEDGPTAGRAAPQEEA